MFGFVTIIGRLGNDPEERETKNQNKIHVFNVATTSKISGEETTIWWKCYLWGKVCSRILPHLKKGSSVIVQGDINRIAAYPSKDGSMLTTQEINVSFISFVPSQKKRIDEKGESQDELDNNDNENNSDINTKFLMSLAV